jgi:hypothetical protein
MIRRKREKKEWQEWQGFLQSHQTEEKVQEKKVGENPATPATFLEISMGFQFFSVVQYKTDLYWFYVH